MEQVNMKITSNGKPIHYYMDKLELFLLGVLIFYIFCFQYVFCQINGLLSFLGVSLLVLEIFRCSIRSYKNIGYIIVFIGITSIIGGITAYDLKEHVRLVINMIQYCLPMLAICGYVGCSEKKLLKILSVVSFSALMLAFSVIVMGEKFTDYGAVTVGGLNTNVLSSFLMVGLLSQLLLLCKCKKKPNKIVLYLAIFTGLIAQMLASSRRGLVIYVFLLVLYAVVVYFVRYKKKSLKKFILFASMMVVVLIFSANFYFLADKYVVLRRLFLGEFNRGDTLREEYQVVAFELFKESPVFGRGFGCVSAKAGMYSHSMYYEVLASTGLLGCILLLFPIVLNIFKYFKAAKKGSTQELKMVSYIGVGGFSSILLSGFAVVSIFDIYFYIMLGILGALSNVLFACKE